jgi:hypothetical protein
MRWMGHVAMGNPYKKERFVKNPEENKPLE